jgi:hypothetical protein
MSRTCLLAAIGVLSSSLAQAQTAPPPGCPAEVRRQFDFWVGNWDVTVAGKPAGVNRIEKILVGCALLEYWQGVGGMSGKSVNFYDPRRERWHKTWVDDRGGSLGLDGAFADGKMVLTGSKKDPATGKSTIDRIKWTPLPADQVRQVWETSTDDGKSWTVAFDGLYTRKK